MNYNDVKNKIFYSRELRAAHDRHSPVRGYGSAGEYIRELQRFSNLVAVKNGVDCDYCSVLALTKYLGLAPYGPDGEAAVQEIMGDSYDRTGRAVQKLRALTKEEPDEELVRDLADLNSGKPEEDLSDAAKVIFLVEEALMAYSLLTREEKEAREGSLFLCSAISGISRDENGVFLRDNLLVRLYADTAGRKVSADRERVDKIKARLQSKMAESGLDLQTMIDKYY